MTSWLRRIRGAVGMGLTWAVGWAVGGIAIGVASILTPFLPWDYFFQVFDAPLPAFAVPGFVAGAFFSLVLGIAGRHHRFEELSLKKFAAWGALGGLLLILFPFALVAVGLASRGGSPISTAQIIAAIGAPFILFSVASATATLWLARRAARRHAVDSADGVAELESSSADGISRRAVSDAALSRSRAPQARQ